MHLYMLAYMSMHESCLLVCHPYFNTMKLWTSDPNLHLSLVGTTFCLFSCLFAFYLFVCYLACLSSHLFAPSILCLPCLSCLPALRLFYTFFSHFPSVVCLLVSCLCLCMYTYGARMHRARARSPSYKEKGRGCEYVDISQAAVFSRFRV